MQDNLITKSKISSSQKYFGKLSLIPVYAMGTNFKAGIKDNTYSSEIMGQQNFPKNDKNFYMSTFSLSEGNTEEPTQTIYIENDNIEKFIANINEQLNYFADKKTSTSIAIPSENSMKNTLPKNTMENYSIEKFNIWTKSIIATTVKIKSEEDISKEEFIAKYSLENAISTASTLIGEIFENVEVKTNLYVDYNEPQYKFLNISIVVGNISENEIENLLDKFDKLQDKFLDSVTDKYNSKITFYLNTN